MVAVVRVTCCKSDRDVDHRVTCGRVIPRTSARKDAVRVRSVEASDQNF